MRTPPVMKAVPGIRRRCRTTTPDKFCLKKNLTLLVHGRTNDRRLQEPQAGGKLYEKCLHHKNETGLTRI
jgi:hypothetical protein